VYETSALIERSKGGDALGVISRGKDLPAAVLDKVKAQLRVEAAVRAVAGRHDGRGRAEPVQSR